MTLETLHFVDFGIVALLFAVLLGISSFEYLLLREKARLPGQDMRHEALKSASTTAFVGIAISLSLGVFAPALKQYDDWTAIIPLGLLLLWLRYQSRLSEVINFDLLASELDKGYSNIILKIAKENPQLDDPSLYRECVVAAQKPDAMLGEIARVVGKQSMVVPLFAAQSLFQSFVFSRERFDGLLAMLRAENKLPPT